MTKTELLKQIIANDEILQDISSRLDLDEKENPVEYLRNIVQSGIEKEIGFCNEAENSFFFDKWEERIYWWFEAEVGSTQYIIEKAIEKLGAYEVMRQTIEAKSFYCLAYVQDRIIVDILDRIEDELS